jgi:hypothetical protein
MLNLRSGILLSFAFVAAAAAQEVTFTTRPPALPDAPHAAASAMLQPIVTAPCLEHEPNESAANASATSLPSDCTGNAASFDSSSIRINYDGGASDGIEDVFALNLTVPAKLTLDLTNPATADLDLFLFTWVDNAPHFLAVANHDGSGVEEKIVLVNPLLPGTYYIGVSAYSGSSAYNLSLTAPGFSATCTPDDLSLCLNNGRFRVQTDWRTSNGTTGQGHSVLLTHETGYFWFFADTNVETIVKVLDACSLNSRFWVFSGGLTNVEVTLRVTDTVTGQAKTYVNPLGTDYRTIADTGALAVCGGTTCTYTVSPTSQSFSASAGTGSITVNTTAGCGWSASADVPWITITSGPSGSGNGSVSYSVAANSGTSSRSGNVNVAGKVVAITQAGTTASCTYAVSPLSNSFSASGGSGSLSVTTQSACPWTAVANDSWISITSGSSGSGNGSVSYSVAANASSSSRTGTITAAGNTVSITQSGSGSSGSYEGSWNGTTNEGEIVAFTVVGSKVTTFKMSFFFGVPGNSCATTITLNFGVSSQPTISGNGFAFNFNPTGLTTAINVTFGSTNSATGTFGQVTMNNFHCGPATINGFKAGGTFTATK